MTRGRTGNVLAVLFQLMTHHSISGLALGALAALASCRDTQPNAGRVGLAADGGTDDTSADGAEPATPPPPDSQCYFASYPVGSKHCILAPCYIVESPNEFDTCYGSDDDGTFQAYRDGTTVYAARWFRETSIIYLDAATSFPACLTKPGPGPMSLPTGSGAYYATGLVEDDASATDVATFCDDVMGSGTSFGVVEPTFSSDQCYFTSYPVGSKQCITAPCQMTDVADSPLGIDTICVAGSSNSSRIFLSGQTLYATSWAGDIQELIPRGSGWFDQCMAEAQDLSLPTDDGDYYATGLVVGSASGSALAAFCK